MNVQEVVTRVKRIFGDESGVQISDQDIIRWINDAQEDIVVSNSGLMEATATTRVVKNVAEYDSPSNMSTLRSLKYKNRRLKALSFSEFTEYIDNRSPIYVGDPEVFMSWNNKLTLFPTPGDNVENGLTIYYIQHPTPVASLADNLSVPLPYHNAVVSYCLQQAYELDEDFDKAQLKRGQFNETMMKLNDRNKWVSQEYYPRITILPEDGEIY